MMESYTEPPPNAVSLESLYRCKRRSRWTIRGLIIIASLALCAYQVYLVSVLYYTYPTTVDIRLDTSPTVHLPAITLCSELPSTILIDALISLSPSLTQIFSGKSAPERRRLLSQTRIRAQVLSLLQSLPIRRQHALTASWRQLFTDCTLPTWLGSRSGSPPQLNCSQFAPIIETISFQYKCFSLFLNRTRPEGGVAANYEIPKTVVANFKYLLWITLNRDYIFNGFIFIHPPHLSHQFSNPKTVQHLDPNRHQSVTLAFEREIIRLLPPPYETACRDYRRHGWQCREHCLAACKTARYLKEADGWPGDIYADSTVDYHFSHLWRNLHSQAGHLEEADLPGTGTNCTADCGTADDCERVQYDTRTVRVVEREEDDPLMRRAFTIALLPPKEVQMVIQHVPKFAPIEFVIYIGGLLNLYLGFSAISLGIALLTYCTFSSKLQTKRICAPVRQKQLKKKQIAPEETMKPLKGKTAYQAIANSRDPL